MVCPIRFKEISLAKLHFLCVHGNQDEKVTPKVQNERESVGNFTFVDTSEQSLTVHDKAMRARSEFLSETIPETSDRQSESNSFGNFSFVEPETQLAEMRKYLNTQENGPKKQSEQFSSVHEKKSSPHVAHSNANISSMMLLSSRQKVGSTPRRKIVVSIRNIRKACAPMVKRCL